MALTRTLDQMVARVRRTCDVEGTSGVARHPTADIYDELNSGVAALNRLFKEVAPGQRFLASTTISTVSGTSVYALPSDFRSLISIDITANGAKTWMTAFETAERAQLTSPTNSSQGVPYVYALQGQNIELLPIPQGIYTVELRYTPTTTELAGGTSVFDTIERLDDFVVWFASRSVTKKDRLWELHDRLAQDIAKIEKEIRTIARNYDMNAAPRIADVNPPDRFGRRRYR